VALGLQIIAWHDLAAGCNLRWSHDMDEGGGSVDIAGQMKASLSLTDETDGTD